MIQTLQHDDNKVVTFGILKEFMDSTFYQLRMDIRQDTKFIVDEAIGELAFFMDMNFNMIHERFDRIDMKLDAIITKSDRMNQPKLKSPSST